MELSYAIFPAGLGFTRGSRNAWGWGCRCHRRFSPAGGAIAIACVAWHLGPRFFAWNHGVFFLENLLKVFSSFCYFVIYFECVSKPPLLGLIHKLLLQVCFGDIWRNETSPLYAMDAAKAIPAQIPWVSVLYTGFLSFCLGIYLPKKPATFFH